MSGGENEVVRFASSLIVFAVAALAAPIVAVPGAGTADAATTSCSSTAKTSKLVVDTDRGAVRGAATDGVRAWKGIPFAAPPVGKLRWSAPAPHQCWKDTLDTQSFGAPCPQLDGDQAIGSEDCLTLNVWRPDTGTRPRAVMVFVHGGGHVQGSTSQMVGGIPLYDGATLAPRAMSSS